MAQHHLVFILAVWACASGTGQVLDDADIGELQLSEVGPTQAPAPEGGHQDGSEAVLNLLCCLTKIFTALGLGYACNTLGYVSRQKGELAVLGFFLGKIALPLLVFKLVATEDLTQMSPLVILACNVAKLVGCACAGLLGLVAFQIHRPFQERFLTAVVFSAFVMASNDFVVGLPVVEAMDPTMVPHVAANTVSCYILLQPLHMVLFQVGENMGPARASQAVEEVRRSRSMEALLMLKQIILSPLIFMVGAGLLFQALFGWTLETLPDGRRRLPRPLFDILDLWTSPFQMMALFYTGASMSSTKLSVWVATLVSIKVFGCAFIGYCVGQAVLSPPGPAKQLKVDFIGFYGSLPTSSAPLLFAAQFAPQVQELISASIVYGWSIAAPTMFLFAVFMQDTSDNQIAIVQVLQRTAAILSVLCGSLVVASVALLWLRQQQRAPLPASFKLIGAYGTAATIYALVTIIFLLKPSSMCSKEAFSSTWYFFGYCQGLCSNLILYLALLWAGGWPADLRIWKVGAIAVCTFLPTFFFSPHTFTQVCGEKVPGGLRSELNFRALWDMLLMVGVAAYGFLHRRRRRSLRTQQEGNELQEPVNVAKAMVMVEVLSYLMRFVNTYAMQSGRPLRGGFTAMVLIENVLEHAQVVILLVCLLCHKSFIACLRLRGQSEDSPDDGAIQQPLTDPSTFFNAPVRSFRSSSDGEPAEPSFRTASGGASIKSRPSSFHLSDGPGDAAKDPLPETELENRATRASLPVAEAANNNAPSCDWDGDRSGKLKAAAGADSERPLVGSP